MIVRPATEADLAALLLAGAVEPLALTGGLPEGARAAEIDGRVEMVFGYTELWPGNAYAYAVVARESKHGIALTKAANRAAAEFDGLLWTFVLRGFEQGERWARLLKFERMAVLPGFAPGGRDFCMYVRRN